MVTRNRIHRHHISALVRDIVEVVAIIAAGIWALYTFVYAERVKPASEPPTVLLTGSMHMPGRPRLSSRTKARPSFSEARVFYRCVRFFVRSDCRAL
jgi:hypothetical protein